jgi:hypothetical protein
MFWPTAVIARQQEVKHGWMRLALQQYQLVAWQPRMGDLNNRPGGAFQWGSQVLYNDDTTHREFSCHSELKESSQFP